MNTRPLIFILTSFIVLAACGTEDLPEAPPTETSSPQSVYYALTPPAAPVVQTAEPVQDTRIIKEETPRPACPSTTFDPERLAHIVEMMNNVPRDSWGQRGFIDASFYAASGETEILVFRNNGTRFNVEYFPPHYYGDPILRIMLRPEGSTDTSLVDKYYVRVNDGCLFRAEEAATHVEMLWHSAHHIDRRSENTQLHGGLQEGFNAAAEVFERRLLNPPTP